MGFPTWIVLLAAFNEDLTGIPWSVGFTLASVLALAAVVIADLRAAQREGAPLLGRRGRAVAAGLIVFAVLALASAATTHTGLLVLLVAPLAAGACTALVFIAGSRGAGRR